MNLRKIIDLDKFKVAFNGLKLVYQRESSFRYQIYILIMTIVLGIIVKLSIIEWVVIAGVSATVLTFEIINTSIEKIVDVLYPDYHENAKVIKDISAGAVLIAAIGALIVGLFIFIPRFLSLF